MKKFTLSVAFGIILLLSGLSIATKLLFGFSLFFKGWWTLFIIIPCFVNLCNGKAKRTSYGIGLGLGVYLLIASIFSINIFTPLVVAGLFILAGYKLIISDKGRTKQYENIVDERTKYYQEDIWNTK